MAHDSLTHESRKNFNPNLSPRPFSDADPAAHVTRVGTTPTLAVHPASQELARPIHRSVTRHSAIYTSCQLEVYVAATSGTLPQRVKNANQLTARLEHL